MQKITPHLWFDTEAKDAAEFYVSVFENSRVKSVNTISGTPSGDVDMVSLELCGQDFSFISAGPMFAFNPSVSFLVACATKDEAAALWAKLSEGGKALMEFGSYPFSEAYGWTADRFGVSWQVMFVGERPITQKITPTLMFVGDIVGKAEEAMRFYTSVFSGAVGEVMRYGSDQAAETEGNIAHASFTLKGRQFAIQESAGPHEFSFNEAVSLIVRCESQEEIDFFWKKLTAHPDSEQCGWLKDKYGFSWQIVPTAMDEMMASGDQEKIGRVTQAFLKMKKFNIAELKKAFAGL
ncbi:VOC family protein [bacterium]|nr:VOC family protein [bacterium]